MLTVCIDLLTKHSVSKEKWKNDFNVSYRTIERYINDAESFFHENGYDIDRITNEEGTSYVLVPKKTQMKKLLLF